MNSTIIFFSDFGRAMFAHGNITAIIEHPLKSAFKSEYTIHFNNADGHAMSINTGCDFYIYSGANRISTPREWTAFSRTDMENLALQIEPEKRVFSRTGFELFNDIHADLGCLSLQPAASVVPEEKRTIGRLISKKLAEEATA